LDGILSCLQANIERFADRHHLPNILADKVQERGWLSSHRNELVLQQHARSDGDPKQFYDAYVVNANKHGRFFAIDVLNRHRDKIASNSYAYLERATKVDTDEEIFLRTCEIK
jgi:hypothetical protein